MTGGESPVPFFRKHMEISKHFSLPPALRATSLIRGRLGFPLFRHAGGIPHQREACVSAFPPRRWNPSSEGGLGFCFLPRRWNPHQSKKKHPAGAGCFFDIGNQSSRVKASQSSTLVGTTILPARMSALACSTAFRASSVSRVVVGAMSTPPSVRLY